LLSPFLHLNSIFNYLPRRRDLTVRWKRANSTLISSWGGRKPEMA
jgi:hypothetical protein